MAKRASRMGRPPKEGETEKVNLTIPKPLHAYLLMLARDSYAGADVGEVINHLLKLKLAELGAKLEVPAQPPIIGVASKENPAK
jgi:hypothetical protein